MEIKNLKERAKGTIACGAACYTMYGYRKYIVGNPAIPSIPRAGIGVVLSGVVAVEMIYGTERLVEPELYTTIADTKKREKKKQEELKEINEIINNKEKDA